MKKNKQKDPCKTKGLFYETILRSFVESAKPTLIVVDVQPEYESYMGFNVSDFMEWINQNEDEFQSVLFLYNGADTLDMIPLHDLQMWYMEHDLEESIVHTSDFYDKGYAFFRFCMDSGIDDDDIVKLVKYMAKNDITDSREIDSEIWDHFVSEYGAEDVRELLQDAGDMINIPDLMDFLKDYNNDIILTGGGANECLKEVEIALDALDKKYTHNHDWTY